MNKNFILLEEIGAKLEWTFNYVGEFFVMDNTEYRPLIVLHTIKSERQMEDLRYIVL